MKNSIKVPREWLEKLIKLSHDETLDQFEYWMVPSETARALADHVKTADLYLTNKTE